MENQSQKWRKPLSKIHLSFVILLLTMCMGILLIGLPIVAYDKYIIRTSTECAMTKSKSMGQPEFWADEYGNINEPKEVIEVLVRDCNLYSIKLNSEGKYKAYAKGVIWDNDPQYRLVFFSALAFFVWAIGLILMKKWIVWILK